MILIYNVLCIMYYYLERIIIRETLIIIKLYTSNYICKIYLSIRIIIFINKFCTCEINY